MSSVQELSTTEQAKKRFTGIVDAAKATKAEKEAPVRDANWFKRKAFIPGEPVFLGGSEYVGTARARSNHVDACIHFCEEQVALKKLGTPIV